MKILMILTELAPGGAERVVLELTRGLRARKHEVAVVSLKGEPPEERRVIPEGLAECGAKLIFLNADVRHPFRLFALRRIIRREMPDIIHAHLIHPNLLSRLANLFTGIPLVNTIHIAERRSGKQLFFLADKLTFPLCGACTAVSRAAAEFHERKCGLKKGSIQVIYNGSDKITPAAAEMLESLKHEWGLSNCRRIIGSVGRLDPQKGYDSLLSILPAASEILPANETLGVAIIGDGPEREKLIAMAKEISANCRNLRIALPGYRKDAASLIALFDLFVMPSRYEGYGLALTEALSLGVPVFCNGVDSLPELCAFVPEHSVLADFAHTSARELARKMLHAAEMPRFEGKVIMTNAEMCETYLTLYERLKRR